MASFTVLVRLIGWSFWFADDDDDDDDDDDIENGERVLREVLLRLRTWDLVLMGIVVWSKLDGMGIK